MKHDAPAQRFEWFECDRPGCDAVMGSVGGADDEWDDYDPIAEHIEQHERDDARTLERGETVRVVAEKLGNGAPHPLHGRTGVVLEVRDTGRCPVRVQVAGRAVMFAADELARDDGDMREEAGGVIHRMDHSISPVNPRQIDTSGTYVPRG